MFVSLLMGELNLEVIEVSLYHKENNKQTRYFDDPYF